MRILTALSLLTLMSGRAALASFDLMFLPTSHTASGTNNRVVRFDPANRIALGSVGWYGSSSTRYCSILGNDVYLTSGSGTTVFNAYTGDAVNTAQFPVGQTSASPDGGSLWEIDFNMVYNSSPSLVTLGTQAATLVNSNVNSVTGLADNRALIYGSNSSNRLSLQSVSRSGVTSSVELTGVSPALAFHGRSQTKISGGFATTIIAINTGTGIRRFRVGVNLANGVISQTELPFLPTGIWNNLNCQLMILPGHGDNWWVVGDSATSDTVTAIGLMRSDGSFAYTYTTTLVDVPTSFWSGHIVLAPEPGTMAALGLGAVALLRRRRRKSG